MNFGTRCLAAAAGFLLSAAPFTASEAGAPSAGGWAIVQSDGTLGSNLNVTGVTHPRNGVYRISFNQDVSHCAANATLAAHGGKSIVPGYLVAGRNDDVPNQIRVYTFAAVTLIPTDYKFDLLVSC